MKRVMLILLALLLLLSILFIPVLILRLPVRLTVFIIFLRRRCMSSLIAGIGPLMLLIVTPALPHLAMLSAADCCLYTDSREKTSCKGCCTKCHCQNPV